MTLAERIKYARIARGLTQEQFGERLARSRVAVHYWENGKNTPPLVMLENGLVKRTGCSSFLMFRNLTRILYAHRSHF